MLPTPMSTASPSRGLAYKRISLEEMQLRKAKGLCFNYVEKFSKSHICANKKLLVLQMTDDSFDGSAIEFILQKEPYNVLGEEFHRMSLNAMNRT